MLPPIGIVQAGFHDPLAGAGGVDEGASIGDDADMQGLSGLVDLVENEIAGSHFTAANGPARAELLPGNSWQIHAVLTKGKPDQAGAIEARAWGFAAPLVTGADHGSGCADHGCGLV